MQHSCIVNRIISVFPLSPAVSKFMRKQTSLTLDEPLTRASLQRRINDIGFGPHQTVILVICGSLLLFQGGYTFFARRVVETDTKDWMPFWLISGLPVAGIIPGGFISMATLSWGRRANVIISLLTVGVAAYCTSAVSYVYSHVFLSHVGLGLGLPNIFALAVESSPTRYLALCVGALVACIVLGEAYAATASWILPTSCGNDSLCNFQFGIGIVSFPMLIAGIAAVVGLAESPFYMMKDCYILNSLLKNMHAANRISSSDDPRVETRFVPSLVSASTAPSLSGRTVLVCGFLIGCVRAFFSSYPHPESHVAIGSLSALTGTVLGAIFAQTTGPRTSASILPFVLMAVAGSGLVVASSWTGLALVQSWIIFCVCKALSLALLVAVIMVVSCDLRGLAMAFIIGTALSGLFPSFLAMTSVVEEVSFSILFGLAGLAAAFSLGNSEDDAVSFKKSRLLVNRMDLYNSIFNSFWF